MKNFYNITNKNNPIIDNLLKKAAESLKVGYIEIQEEDFDFNQSSIDTSNQLVYKVSTSQLATTIEASIISNNTSTFRIDPSIQSVWLSAANQDLILEKNGVNIPKTIHAFSEDRDKLKKYINTLKGFPVILKVMGGSHGVGVMKIDSYSSLFSVLDFISTQGHKIKLKEFIKTNTSKRLIVLGNKVIDSIEYITQKDEFRSNIGEEPDVISNKFSKSTESLAIKSVSILGFEFGGVDILEDENGKDYVAEVNFPCNFARAELLTGTNIAEQMIDHLIKKSNTLNQTQS